jgi:hypothetical protein
MAELVEAAVKESIQAELMHTMLRRVSHRQVVFSKEILTLTMVDTVQFILNLQTTAASILSIM